MAADALKPHAHAESPKRVEAPAVAAEGSPQELWPVLLWPVLLLAACLLPLLPLLLLLLLLRPQQALPLLLLAALLLPPEVGPLQALQASPQVAARCRRLLLGGPWEQRGPGVCFCSLRGPLWIMRKRLMYALR